MAQLRAAGMTARMIACRVRLGRLFRVHACVYAVGRPPATGVEHAMAAVLAGGPGACLSHASAAALWGWSARWEVPCHVAVARDRRPSGIVTHHLKLAFRDRRLHEHIPVTSPARTLLDWAPALDDRGLSRALNDARVRGQLTLGSIRDLVTRVPTHPSSRRLKPLLERGGRPTRSSWEDDFVSFCARYGLPEPEINARVAGYEVDALFRQHRVIVELDSWSYHRDRAAFENDRERDTNTAALGFLTVRLTWRRIEGKPEQEAFPLSEILRGRG